MATYIDFEELEIWKEARRLFKIVVELTDRDNVKHEYKFRSNMRESAGSVMDNIAEGFERDSNLEFINHLGFSKGSAGECRCQGIRGADCGYWTEEEASELSRDYKKLNSHIRNYIKYLNNCEFRGLKFKNRRNA